MKKQFLVGNFLPAYSDSFHFPDGLGRQETKPDPEWLARGFAERNERGRSKRRAYTLRMQVATIAALLVAIGATAVNLQGGSTLELAMVEQETVDLQEITQTVQEQLPPPPPKPAVPIAVPDDQVLEDDALDLDASLDLEESLASVPPPPPVVEEVAEDTEPEVFVVVEERPEMIGGVAELARSVKYPNIARQAGIEGMVVVKVVVTSDGEPENPTILKSPSDVLNTAAIEAVMKQRFKPGRQRGRAVACYMAIPVRFRLTASAI